MNKILSLVGACGLITLLLNADAAWAETPVYKMKVKDHAFFPTTLSIPADQKVKLVITNEDPTPMEFESYDLNREKVIPANSEGTFFVGPLNTGTYALFDDFRRDITKGTITVSPPR